MKIKDYEKWMNDDYVSTERFVKKPNKKTKKFELREEDMSEDKRRMKKK